MSCRPANAEIVRRPEAVRRLRELRAVLSSFWSWEAVDQQFWNSGGTPQMAREFFDTYAPNPPHNWRLLVPPWIARRREIRK